MIEGDNYGYFLQVDDQSVLAIDVPNGKKMLATLKAKGWKLEALLLTHSHHDHIVDLPELLEQTGCSFYYPEGSDGLPKGIGVVDGQELLLFGHRLKVIETSGHSPLDLSFWFMDLNLCFCGDTLFAWGCGRMFSGPAALFWESLKRLRSLPDDTLLCCGHEYAGDNRRFYEKTFPDLEPLSSQSEEGLMPLDLKTQKVENPFLRADDPEIAKALGLEGKEPAVVFKKLRELRNHL
jgi:hydroxyacylglutathione hydrolase